MKRTPLTRKTPLRAKKGIGPGEPRKPVPAHKRVSHERLRPKESVDPTPEQKRFWRWLRFVKGCVITGVRGDRSPASMACTIHHVTSDGFKRIRRDHWQVVPLRGDMHQAVWNNTDSVEAIGHAAFAERWGVDLLGRSRELKAEWEAAGCP